MQKQIPDIRRLTGNTDQKRQRYISRRVCLSTDRIQTVLNIRAGRIVCIGPLNTVWEYRNKPLLDVFSPEIRDSSFYNGWNHLMRLIEFDCNLAYGTLSDPNNTDKTAEEVRASKQRSYSFVASCQIALQRALEDLVDAMSFWCDIYNLCPSGACRLSASWDDS